MQIVQAGCFARLSPGYRLDQAVAWTSQACAWTLTGGSAPSAPVGRCPRKVKGRTKPEASGCPLAVAPNQPFAGRRTSMFAKEWGKQRIGLGCKSA